MAKKEKGIAERAKLHSQEKIREVQSLAGARSRKHEAPPRPQHFADLKKSK